MGTGGLEERRLVHAELADPADPAGSSTSGVPCSTTAFMTVHQHTPSSSATLGHRAGQLTDLPARLRSGPPGQHDLGVELLGALGPRLRRAATRGTATGASPTPAERVDRSTADRGPPPAPGPATRHACHSPTTHHHGSRLHRDTSSSPVSTTSSTRNLESQQRLGEADTVIHAGASSSLLPSAARRR